jgi:hypothetical protein
MQNYEKYTKQIHTASDAIHRVESVAENSLYIFIVQFLTTLQNSFLFVSALQMNENVTDWIELRGFQFSKFSWVLVLLLFVMTVSSIKEKFVAVAKREEVELKKKLPVSVDASMAETESFIHRFFS